MTDGNTEAIERQFAFIMDVIKYDGNKVKLGIPIGMTLGELEDILHEKYWAPPTDAPKDPTDDCDSGAWVRASDYDALAAKLAEVTAHNAYLEAALATYTEQNRPTKGSLKRHLAVKAILAEIERLDRTATEAGQ